MYVGIDEQTQIITIQVKVCEIVQINVLYVYDDLNCGIWWNWYLYI